MLPNFLPTVVFAGLRPSRKPRWLLLLPRHPLRLPLSRQGPRSRRRRSWALTMRSRRTPQTTAKVRRIHVYTHAHTLKSSVPAHYFHSLYICHTELKQWPPCLLSLLVAVNRFPLLSLRPDAVCGRDVRAISVTCLLVVTLAFQGCWLLPERSCSGVSCSSSACQRLCCLLRGSFSSHSSLSSSYTFSANTVERHTLLITRYLLEKEVQHVWNCSHSNDVLNRAVIWFWKNSWFLWGCFLKKHKLSDCFSEMKD